MDIETQRYIDRKFEAINRRLRNICSRGSLEMLDDGKKMQTSQVRMLSGEVADGFERVQQYGFSSNPQAGAEVFVLACGADRSHGLVFSCDDRRFRVKGSKPGEVVIYTDEGDTITLKRGNEIEFKTKHLVIKAEDEVSVETKKYSLSVSERAEIAAPIVDIRADVLGMTSYDGSGSTQAMINGKLDVSDDVVAGGISGKFHTHSGVQTGSGNTDRPVGGNNA